MKDDIGKILESAALSAAVRNTYAVREIISSVLNRLEQEMVAGRRGYEVQEDAVRQFCSHLREKLCESLEEGFRKLEEARQWAGRRQPTPDYVQAALDYIAGPARIAEREAGPNSILAEERTCNLCGDQALVLCERWAGVYTERSLCECHLPEALQVKGREIRAAAEAQKRRLEEKAEADLREGRRIRNLLSMAQTCASGQLRMHNRCTDRLQNFEECSVCRLKNKKATEKRERTLKNGQPERNRDDGG